MNERCGRSNARVRVLLVDDDIAFCVDIESLMSNNYEVETASTAQKAIELFGGGYFDAVLLDIDLGRGIDGFDLIDRFRRDDPHIPIIMVTQDASASSAVAALKKGASDYIDKKPDLVTLEKHISAALELQRLNTVNRTLRRDIEAQTGPMVGESETMAGLRREILHAAQATSPILITGETGTGKELVAREIHSIACPDTPFVAINCAAVPHDLFEARLFGNERGAFTGAGSATQGVFELASDGVLFLDEITEIEPALQAKLLRVVEEREFERIGGCRKLHFKGKIVASTNMDLKMAIETGGFRKDLFYRFNTFVLNVPPLRDRRGDIALLARHFLRSKATELKKPPPILCNDIMIKLCAYDWPGNVRELENAIEAFVVRGTFLFPVNGVGPYGPFATPQSHNSPVDAAGYENQDIYEMPYQDAKDSVMDEFKKKYIEVVLASCEGDVHEAARRMGLSRFGLQKMMKEVGM